MCVIYSQSTISYNANKHIELAVRLEAKQPCGLFADASWSRGNTLASEAEGQRFKSRAGQIGHNVANGWSRCNNAEMGPPTYYTLLRYTTTIIKDLIWWVLAYVSVY